MRAFDFSPLLRTTVGFDHLAQLLDGGPTPHWPPYNIEKQGDDKYRVSLAVAGFAPDEIDVSQEGNTLTVTGKQRQKPAERDYLHKGIAFRDFRQVFNLADYVMVTEARLENGLLSIELAREVPDRLKPRRIDVTTGGLQRPGAPSAPHLIDHPEAERAAA